MTAIKKHEKMKSVRISVFVLLWNVLCCATIRDTSDARYRSILESPRLHFSGRFIVNAATVNNLIKNYNSDEFIAHHGLPTNEGGSGGWNPKGTNDFFLKDVKIKRVCYDAEECTTDRGIDPIIGETIQDGGFQTPAKLVDLDPKAQKFTQVWGLKLHIPEFLQADVGVLTLQRFWKRINSLSPKNDFSYTGTFHGPLSNIIWDSATETSKIIDQLREDVILSNSAQLSVKFVLDTFDENRREGRIYGIIGYQGVNSPTSSILGRVLVSQNRIFYQDSPFVINKDTNRAIFDFSGSLPCDENGHLLQHQDEYFVIAYPKAVQNVTTNLACNDQFDIIGKLPLGRQGWLENETGIVTIELGESKARLLANIPVVVMKVKDQSSGVTCIEIVMKECEDGIHLRPFDEFSFRKESRGDIDVKLIATKFGRPWPYLEIGFVCVNSSNKTDFCWPDIDLPEGLKTDEQGILNVRITSPLVQTPRTFIDGQLYPIHYYPKGTCLEQNIEKLKNQTDYVIILRVFDHFEIPEKITWTEHVYPIFKQYANLYPVMKGQTFDISDYHSVVKHKNIISLSMNLPVTHTSYMPVTRDLSKRKRRMITKWLADEKPQFGDIEKVITVSHLRELLQTALEVEHSTLPPYLTALWSIRDGYNRQVHRLIKTIIRQEMLHMGLVANLINAIGGSPSLIHSTFIPNYPSHLPGGLQPDLVVSLEKLSPKVIENVFMKIERPDLNEKDRSFRKVMFKQIRAYIVQQYCNNASAEYECRNFPPSKTDHHYNTIRNCYAQVKEFWKPSKKGKAVNGQSTETTGTNWPSYKSGIASFYTYVLYVIAKLTKCGTDGAIFTGDPNRQLVTDDYSYGNAKLFRVTDYVSAVKAVMTIIEEGEGTSDCDPAVHYFKAADDLSHYSMFHTIVKGHKVKIKKQRASSVSNYVNSTTENCKDQTYDFSGQSIRYIPSATWPILKNAKENNYQRNSLIRLHGRIFKRLYNKLLASLHKSFNGQKEFFVNARFLMYAVDYYARQLVKMPINRTVSPYVGPNAAPIFKWMKTEVWNVRSFNYFQNHYSNIAAEKTKIVHVPVKESEKKVTKSSKNSNPVYRGPKKSRLFSGRKERRKSTNHRRRCNRRRRVKYRRLFDLQSQYARMKYRDRIELYRNEIDKERHDYHDMRDRIEEYLQNRRSNDDYNDLEELRSGLNEDDVDDDDDDDIESYQHFSRRDPEDNDYRMQNYVDK